MSSYVYRSPVGLLDAWTQGRTVFEDRPWLVHPCLRVTSATILPRHRALSLVADLARSWRRSHFSSSLVKPSQTYSRCS